MQDYYSQDMRSNYLLVVLLICSSVTAFGQKKLGYNLKVDDQYTFVQKTSQEITQEMEGMTHSMNNEIQGAYTMQVKSITKTGYIIAFSYTHFKMVSNSNLAGEIMNIDTAKESDPSDMQANIFKGLIGVAMEMEMLNTGKIVQITGTENLINAMVANSGITDDATKQQVYKAMESEFGSNTLASSFEQFTYIYPETKVRVGDNWQNKHTGDLTADNTWTYVGAKNKERSISGLSDIVLSTATEAMSMTLTGTQTTQIVCDAKSGFIKQFNSKSTGTGDSYLTNTGDLAYPTKIVTITEYSIK